MPDNLNTMSQRAADLGKLHEQREAARRLEAEVAAKQAEDAALQKVAEWERAMQRTFKGIMPRPMRHAFLRQAADRQDREG